MATFRPKQTKDKEEWPVGFHFGKDVDDGRYVDENGQPLTAQRINEILAQSGSGVHKITLDMRYRLPDDPINHYRRRNVVVHVVGALTKDSLARVIAAANRTMYGRGTEVLQGQHNVTDLAKPREGKRKHKRSSGPNKPGQRG